MIAKKSWLFIFVLCTLLLVGCNSMTAEPASINTTSEACTTPEPVVQVVYETEFVEVQVEVSVEKELKATPSTLIQVTDLTEAVSLLESSQLRLDAAQALLDASIALDYDVNHPVYQLALQEIEFSQEDVFFYTNNVDELEQAEKERLQNLIDNGEYPSAATVWYYMKYTLGWNDYVCAGVMGNLMAEVGGQTLNLNIDLYYSHDGHTYYGICQWKDEFYPEIHGADLDSQLEFLKDTVEKEFKGYGYLHEPGFTYEDFIALDDEREAALIFARVYERCRPISHNRRQDNAEKALIYFAPSLGEE